MVSVFLIWNNCQCTKQVILGSAVEFVKAICSIDFFIYELPWWVWVLINSEACVSTYCVFLFSETLFSLRETCFSSAQVEPISSLTGFTHKQFVVPKKRNTMPTCNNNL